MVKKRKSKTAKKRRRNRSKQRTLNICRQLCIALQTYYNFDSEIELRTFVDIGDFSALSNTVSWLEANRNGVTYYFYRYDWPYVFKVWRKIYGRKDKATA